MHIALNNQMLGKGIISFSIHTKMYVKNNSHRLLILLRNMHLQHLLLITSSE